MFFGHDKVSDLRTPALPLKSLRLSQTWRTILDEEIPHYYRDDRIILGVRKRPGNIASGGGLTTVGWAHWPPGERCCSALHSRAGKGFVWPCSS